MSTVKDVYSNVRRFVERNLAHGIDHMVVFLDAADPRCERYLADHPHVTSVVTDDLWWDGRRPPGLNRRQVTNANIAKSLLAQDDWATWLFHIDADEVVHIDRDRIERLGDEVTVLQLDPLEAVSRYRGREPRYFKRLLSEEELVLLTTLGRLPRPDNRQFFHGHVAGKSAVRPRSAVHLGTHKPRDGAHQRIVGYRADWLKVLHLESTSGVEFVRKWNNLATSGTRPHTRSSRSQLLIAIEALNGLAVSDAVRRKTLVDLYKRTTEDDLGLLRDLGLVERVDLGERLYEPRRLPDPGRENLANRLAGVASMDKQVFREGSVDQVRDALAELTR